MMETDLAAGVRPGAFNEARGQGFFDSHDEKNRFYNGIFYAIEACDEDIREKLGKLFDELRRVNRAADQLLREQENRWFGWV